MAKICTVGCMADRPDMFGSTRGVFGDGQFSGTMQNVGPTLIAMTTFGLGKGPVAYRRVIYYSLVNFLFGHMR